MPAPQTFKNHGRFDPLFHFILLPVLLYNIGRSIYIAVHQWPQHRGPHLWWIVMAIAVFLVAERARSFALKAQNRTIRLEERLRFAALLAPAELAASGTLTMKQYIALRFASDAEVPALVSRALAEGLTPKQIKQNIVTWRPDYDRV